MKQCEIVGRNEIEQGRRSVRGVSCKGICTGWQRGYGRQGAYAGVEYEDGYGGTGARAGAVCWYHCWGCAFLRRGVVD